MLLTSTLPVLLLSNWASTKRTITVVFPHAFAHYTSLLLLLKTYVICSFPLRLTSLAEHQVFSARIPVWIPLWRYSILTLGLDNQCPLLHTSEASKKKRKKRKKTVTLINHNTVKRSQQINLWAEPYLVFLRDWREDTSKFEVAAAQTSVLTHDSFFFSASILINWWV